MSHCPHLHRRAASTLKQWEDSHKKYSGFLLKKPCPTEAHGCSDFPGWRVLRKTFPDAWMMFCRAEGGVCAAFPESCRCRCYRREMYSNINKTRTAGWRIGTLTTSGDWKLLPVRMLNLSSFTVWFKFVCLSVFIFIFFPWSRYRWRAFSLKKPVKT